MINKKIIFLLLFVCSLLSANNFTKLKEEIKAPNFILLNTEDEKISLKSFLGKTVLLNFWASWCPPCKREMPSIQKFYAKNNKSIEVIAIASGEGEDNVFPFISTMKPAPTFNILYDDKKYATRLYSIQAMPTSFIINKKGYITHYAIGEIDYMGNDFLKIINKIK